MDGKSKYLEGSQSAFEEIFKKSNIVWLDVVKGTAASLFTDLSFNQNLLLLLTLSTWIHCLKLQQVLLCPHWNDLKSH